MRREAADDAGFEMVDEHLHSSVGKRAPGVPIERLDVPAAHKVIQGDEEPGWVK